MLDGKSLSSGSSCECGARLERGQRACRKCIGWQRWLRRHARRRKTNKRRAQTRRSAGRPSNTAEMG